MKKILCIMTTAVLIFFTLNFTTFAEEKSEELTVSAKACILIEAGTGKVLYSKNSDTKQPMASTTKIMTTLLCLESGDLDTPFVADPEAIKVEGSTMGITEGDIVTKRALCYGMMLPSGNDAANAAAIKIGGTYENFAKLMNERAEEIGMTRTCFVTPSGLEAKGHGASASDMALLTREALRNSDFREICSQQQVQVSFGNPPYTRWLTNTNKLLEMYDGVIGVKTGFTDEAGRCLVSSCERNGITLICVTLNASDDWHDHIKLYDNGFSIVQPMILSQQDKLYTDVVGSEKDKIEVGSDKTVTIGSVGDSLDKITVKAILPPFLYAPVKKGNEVGKLEFYYENRFIDSIPLYAIEDAELYIPADNGNKLNTFIKKIKRILGT